MTKKKVAVSQSACWTDATWCIKTSSGFQHIKHMQGQQKGVTPSSFSPSTWQFFFLHITGWYVRKTMQDTLIYNQQNWLMRDEAAKHKHTRTHDMSLRVAQQKKKKNCSGFSRWCGATKLIQPSKRAAMNARSVNVTLQDIFRNL